MSSQKDFFRDSFTMAAPPYLIHAAGAGELLDVLERVDEQLHL